MNVTIYGEIFPCDRAVKGPDWVRLYQNREETAAFFGITDFSTYSLEGGQWEASSESPSLESLQEESALLKAQIAAASERQEFLEDCIAEMAMQVYGA